MPLDGASTRRLTPKQIQAEHYSGHIGTQNNTVANAEGGRTVGYADTGEFIYFEPVSLKGIDQLTIRYAAGIDGGIVDVRYDAPDGPVIGTATLPTTASWTDFQNVTIPLTTDDRSGRLYFTFRGRPGMNPNDLFDLDEFTFIGKGVASNATPTASAQADKVAGPAPLTVNFTGTGSDPDGDAITYAWDFTSDGTVDATTANATHTYAEPGQYTATFTVSDGDALAQRGSRHRGVPAAGVVPRQRRLRRHVARPQPLERGPRGRELPVGRRRLAEPQRPAGRGHPRRGHRAAQHRAPGPARTPGPWTATARVDLEPDGQLPERRPA